jgi:phosphoserine aminotransferase
MKRVINFNAGPSTLPLSVLEKAQRELVDFRGHGLSIMEASHRSKLYEDVHNGAIEKMRNLYTIPDDYAVLFLQGGASMQFAMVPMNLYRGGVIEYANTGAWSKKAIKEAQIQKCQVQIVAESSESNFDHIPDAHFSDTCDYAHITSNNTIYGTQYKCFPETKAPLVVDASSDIFSYPVEWSKIDLMYAGAQKNAGPSGVTIVIVKKSLIENVSEDVPTMLRYKTHADANSLYNTPPTFGIYMLSLMMEWLEERGGIEAVAQYNEEKASLLYDAIDNSNGFYTGHARKQDRSLMNVTFNIRNKDAELEAQLVWARAAVGPWRLDPHPSDGQAALRRRAL